MSGEQIAGRYRLIEPLGRGAMSSVWLAEDPELDRLVAVKLLSPAADRARFDREARAAASLSHPNLCALYDYGESGGKPYMVLEYLPNGSLEDRLRTSAPLPDAETLRIAIEVAAGLAHAHERGLVHRDLKPANVLFDREGHPKIADFGIARMTDSGALTEAGTVLGTASYISPEQASGRVAGPPSDVYSFGVILFRMLTGRLPFIAANAMEVVRMHRDELPPAVAEFRPDAPVRLEGLTAAALAKDPAARPADGAALLAALQGTDTDATRVLRRVDSPPARRRIAVLPLALAALGAVVLLAVGIAAALLTTSGGSGTVTTAPLPGPSLPLVPAVIPSTTALTTTAPTTTTATTTAASTTAATSTAPTTTTAATTTAATTTAVTPPPTLPTTTAATTTAPPTTTTTAATTTTVATTTASAPPTTTSAP